MIRLYLLVVAFSIAVLYGATYQQFRFFSLAAPGGAIDAIQYVAMARGIPPDDLETRQYRWLTPGAARLIQPVARIFVADDELSIRLAFYFVNFAFSLLACLALFRALQKLGYSLLLSLIGVTAFASSRIIVLATGTPLVDAGYFCAIAIIVWLTLEKQALALALLLPVLVLTKETIIPFLLLPLFTDLRKTPTIWAGLAGAAMTFVVSGSIVRGYHPGADPSYAAAVLEHARELGSTTRQLLTIAGVHDLQNGFSLFLPLSVIGAWLNARHRYHDVPLFIAATVPIAFGLALLSNNLGRMFFAAFPAVIAYALISVEHVARSNDPAGKS